MAEIHGACAGDAAVSHPCACHAPYKTGRNAPRHVAKYGKKANSAQMGLAPPATKSRATLILPAAPTRIRSSDEVDLDPARLRTSASFDILRLLQLDAVLGHAQRLQLVAHG